MSRMSALSMGSAHDEMASKQTEAGSTSSRRRSAAAVRVRFDDVQLELELPNGDDHIQAWIRRTGELYEADLLRDILHRVVRPGIVIDVGANIGNHTVFFGKVLRRRVIALEPFSTVFEVLARNVAINGLRTRVTLLPDAA